MCLEWSRRVRTHRNCQKAWENIGSCGRHWKLQKMSGHVGKCRKLWNVWLVTGKTSGRLVWQIRWYHGMWQNYAKHCITLINLIQIGSTPYLTHLFYLNNTQAVCWLLTHKQLSSTSVLSVMTLFFYKYSWIATRSHSSLRRSGHMTNQLYSALISFVCVLTSLCPYTLQHKSLEHVNSPQMTGNEQFIYQVLGFVLAKSRLWLYQTRSCHSWSSTLLISIS